MNKLVLIVEDDEMCRNQVVEALEEDYLLLCAQDAKTALMELEKRAKEISVVILDLSLPDQDGFEVLAQMKKQGYLEYIPVIITSDKPGSKAEEFALSMGAFEYTKKPVFPNVIKLRVRLAAEMFHDKKDLAQQVKIKTEQLRAQYNMLLGQAQEMKKKNQSIIDILGTVVECRNLESGDHIFHVKEYTRILATQLATDYPEYRLTKEKIDIIVDSSALHDIGKITIPDEILLKPGKLTRDEFDYMKSHTTRGCEILNNIKGIWEKDYVKCCHDICRYHHERYDGKGYPDGLSGEEIPISAQIVSLADVYDALVAERCYKEAYSAEQAYGMIMQGECGVFSPKLLEAFQKSRPHIESVAQKKPGESTEQNENS